MKPHEGWIQLADLFKTEEPSQENVGGATVRLLMSPYEVPEAARGWLDRSKDRFVLEFKYLTEEPTEKKAGDDPSVQLILGKNSGRLYRCEVAMDTLLKGKFEVHVPDRTAMAEMPSVVEKEIDRLAARPNAQQSYRLVSKAGHAREVRAGVYKQPAHAFLILLAFRLFGSYASGLDGFD